MMLKQWLSCGHYRKRIRLQEFSGKDGVGCWRETGRLQIFEPSRRRENE